MAVAKEIKNYLDYLVEWEIEDPTEQDYWDAIKEACGIDDYIEDGDLTEWL